MDTARASAPRLRRLPRRELLKRLAPTAAAAIPAALYVLLRPPSLDLAAHLFRAHLFAAEGFGLWNNWWYSGHDIVSYSVLFPAVSATLTPQLAAALAATGTAAVFEPLTRLHFGSDAWLGAVVFGAATATDLYTGRLALAFGALPALAAVAAVDCRRTSLACALALLTALCSPVAALFAALAAVGYALGRGLEQHRLGAIAGPLAVAAAALAPIGLLAIVFPEGGSEPFGFLTMVPILVISVLAVVAFPRERLNLRAGIAVYAVGTLAVYVLSSPIGSNIARLGTFLAAPIAALVWWRRRTALLAIVALPLLYIEWQAPVADLASASGNPSTSAAYYRPLLRFLDRESTPPAQAFRIEIPFTQLHWEAYWVAIHFPLARGWERQLDIRDNPLFYDGHLTAASYERWLHQNAVRFVAVADTQLDYSAKAEAALISHGLPYLRLVMRSRHWRVYAVAHATPIVDGPATLRKLGPDSLQLTARAPGTVVIHVRFTPYWKLTQGSGCVGPDGAYTRLRLRRAGTVKLATEFSFGRIGATSPRCTRHGRPPS